MTDPNEPGLAAPGGLDRRDFMRLLAGAGAAASLPLASCGGSTANGRRAIVLGLDGLDPSILRRLIDAGRAPNFKRLATMGAFRPLQTTMPALSPVAWSSFITGLTPGGHGIADFIARDPATYLPTFAIYANREPSMTLDLGDFHLPLIGGGPESLRRGTPFWAHLTERGIPAWISRMPTNFPVEETATKAISGMGTPDLADAYGVFSYYTSDPFEHYPDLTGGVVQHVDVRRHRVDANLLGPHNTLHTPPGDPRDPHAGVAKVPFTLWLDPSHDAARLEIQGRTVLLNVGEYSDWVEVDFDLLPVVGRVSGIVRFLLRQARPHCQLYVTPVNINPSRQAAPVTYPKELGAEIARDIGAFWTKGLPCDTKALDHRIINDADYVAQAELILAEQQRLFRHLWSRFDDGLFFFYVSSTDQDAHMLWRNMDPDHPLHASSDRRFAGWIPHLYEEMDRLVGEVLPAVDDSTLLMICSDHGFAPFARQLHLNSWLRENGWLAVKPGAERKEETSIADVDWSRTVAYGIGFNGLYLNLQGREAQGIVPPEKAAELAGRISRELEAIIDPDTGRRPVAKVYRREAMYTGAATPLMPEMLVGYTPGYRSSSPSVLGSAGKAIIDLNPWAWSGDHSMARDLVPGSLLLSRPVTAAQPSILDLPVTLLDWFGVERPAQMTGSSLL